MSSVFSFQKSSEYFAHVFRSKGSVAVHTKRMGYRSPRVLEMVCKGDRPASPDFLFRFKKYKKLSDQEFLFLGLLVKRDRDRAKNKVDAQLEAEIQGFIRQMKLSHEELTESTFRMVSDWQHFVLKQLFRNPRKMKIPEIAKTLKHKLSEEVIFRSLKTLQDLGVIEYDSMTNWIRPLKLKGFVSQAEVPSQAIRSHHRQMMQRAQEALEDVPISDREILSLTFSFDPKNIQQIKRDLNHFRDLMESKYLEEDSKKIYQLNIQFFPHTE